MATQRALKSHRTPPHTYGNQEKNPNKQEKTFHLFLKNIPLRIKWKTPPAVLANTRFKITFLETRAVLLPYALSKTIDRLPWLNMMSSFCYGI